MRNRKSTKRLVFALINPIHLHGPLGDLLKQWHFVVLRDPLERLKQLGQIQLGCHRAERAGARAELGHVQLLDTAALGALQILKKRRILI